MPMEDKLRELRKRIKKNEAKARDLQHAIDYGNPTRAMVGKTYKLRDIQRETARLVDFADKLTIIEARMQR